MYAIVEINGKQYKAEEGKFIEVDLLAEEPGASLKLDRVLLVSDGTNSSIGQPTVEGASVQAKVLGNIKAKKVVVYKMKPKKGYRRKQGHRQQYTKIMIEKIDAKVAA